MMKVTPGKAKSHPALAASRPAAASAAALVRDAVARLPRGEGARQEVEDLVRQSQFLSPEVRYGITNQTDQFSVTRL